jgi:hypothetical protein
MFFLSTALCQCAAWAAFACLLALSGCAGTTGFTVDDGRKVDETLLANIRSYGQGEQMLRPAIQRSAELKDPDCDKQWELPFAVATSYGWSDDEKVAWVRALHVDERMTVVAASPRTRLQPGDKIVGLNGQADKDTSVMLTKLAALRDEGKPFFLNLASSAQQRVEPFEVCRGYARLAPPNTPDAQDYHWLLSVHPLQVVQTGALSDDEALWIVLWSQGLSEEGGARMKAYHYTTKIAGTLYNLFTLATGLKGAAMAADAVAQAARSAAANVATDVLKQQLIAQGQALAEQRLRDGLTDSVKNLAKQQASSVMAAAASNRVSLNGVARVGATVFDRADLWAFERIRKLGGSQMAGFTLHQRMVEHGFAANAFAFEVDRLEALTKVARDKGLGGEVEAALGGLRPEQLALDMQSMPLASSNETFSFETPISGGPSYTRGLVDTLLEMPAESGAKTTR